MAAARRLFPTFLACLLVAARLSAQESTGTISGRVVDSTSQQPLANANVVVEGTRLGAVSQNDGSFRISLVPAGTQRVRVSRIGYTPISRSTTVTAGGTSTLDFALANQAVSLSEMVVVGYGTQRREAVTGSVATVSGDEANVGVVTNPTQMVQGRVAGVQVTTNNGEPGSGASIRIRGGTSISGSNEPLYVIDGVPIDNSSTEPAGIGLGGDEKRPPQARNPLNILNPSDIESITVLKDASATAIYGSRGANGVILIETKKGTPGTSNAEYEFQYGSSSPSQYLDVLSGAEYRNFVQQSVSSGILPNSKLTTLGSANTNWEKAVTRSAATQNHNLAFTGGGADTRYRASLNYMDQKGVVLANGFQRLQGRLNGSHNTFDNKLRLALNLNASNARNDYLPYESTGGFQGGIFLNTLIFNPTQPVRTTDPATGTSTFYEYGPGAQGIRNPVAMAEQIKDNGNTTRVLGNTSAELDILHNLTGKVNVGVDRSNSERRTYYPIANPIGAQYQGRAIQASRDNTNRVIQTYLTFHDSYFTAHDFELLGGYEYSDYDLGEFTAEGRKFISDATRYNNLGGAAVLITPVSFREQSRLVSFFSRLNYGFGDRVFLTGVLRRDGSSRFGAGHKWAVFPAVSGAWHLTRESFLQNAPFTLSDLKLRAGWGLQGNPGVAPYSSLITLEPSGGANYTFGNTVVTGLAPTRNANPDLKWEETAQTNVALDWGFLQDRITGSVEYYVKNTKDLLLTVDVPQPAVVSTRLENVGRLRNKGIEAAIDGRVWERGSLLWNAGLVFAHDDNEIIDLGKGRNFLITGIISGQGLSGGRAQRVIPGQPLGTFYGPRFTRVVNGHQMFVKYQVTRDASGRETSRRAVGEVRSDQLSGDDFTVLGNANPNYTLGLHSQVSWRGFDASFLINSWHGNKVFNNTAAVYGTKANAVNDRNFLRSALSTPDSISEAPVYSSRWIEDGSFVRLQNITIGYALNVRALGRYAKATRIYVSGDNLLLLTDYSGYDPEVDTNAGENGIASRGIDYLNYPRPRTITAGIRVGF